jgi:hypothetical protein
MDTQEVFKRAYSTLLSLKTNLPTAYHSHEKYVSQYHEIIEKLSALGFDLTEFRIPEEQMERAVTGSNYVTGEVDYADYREVERTFFLLKLDALLNYFSLSGGDGEKGTRIGFNA